MIIDLMKESRAPFSFQMVKILLHQETWNSRETPSVRKVQQRKGKKPQESKNSKENQIFPGPPN